LAPLDFAEVDATEQARLCASGQITAAELVEAAIERIELLNPVLNAVVAPMFESARTAARDTVGDSIFSGVPFLVKDLIASVADVPLTQGSAWLRDYVPNYDSELVRRLRRAGLILIGKTNTPEFGNGSTVEPWLFGACRNPWDLRRSPGGSSGGSAAAVASGMVPMAHGNDGGGSIRIPASCCGLFGLKPTRGRVSHAPDFGDFFSGLVQEHALTRSVRDSASLLDAISGPSPGAPAKLPVPYRPFLQDVSQSPGRLRIGFSTRSPTGVASGPDCATAVARTAALCEDLGHDVVEASPEFEAAAVDQAFLDVWCDGNLRLVESMARRRGNRPGLTGLEPITRELVEIGRQRTGADHLQSLRQLQRGTRDIARFFGTFDVWLTPTVAQPPPPIGSFETRDPQKYMESDSRFSPFTAWANITGQPAMSVPLHWTGDGLPVGVQFTGRFGDESTLFRLAGQLERARPWGHRRPHLPPAAASSM
jgi:amidase